MPVLRLTAQGHVFVRQQIEWKAAAREGRRLTGSKKLDVSGHGLRIEKVGAKPVELTLAPDDARLIAEVWSNGETIGHLDLTPELGPQTVPLAEGQEITVRVA